LRPGPVFHEEAAILSPGGHSSTEALALQRRLQLSGISYQLTVQELFIVHCSLFIVQKQVTIKDVSFKITLHNFNSTLLIELS